MKYIGEECFSCGITFKDGDDIVVCPECGTPYHRICYKEAGECLNHQLHENGGSWEKKNTAAENAEAISNENQPQEAKPAAVICSHCNTLNFSSDEKCRKCGQPLDSANNTLGGGAFSTDEFGGIDPARTFLGFNPSEEHAENVTTKDLCDFVDTNTLYYIPLFKRMKDFGSKISFNFVCLLFPYFYFANRRMWLWTIITAFLSIILNIPMLLYAIGDQVSAIPFMQEIIDYIYSNNHLISNMIDICNFADWLLRFTACLLGNWLYYRFSIRSISKIKNIYKYTSADTAVKIREKGGVKPVNIIFTTLILLGIAIAVYFAVMFFLVYLQQGGTMAA